MQKRLTEQGLRFLEEGQFEKAGHILSLLITHFPDNAEAHHMLGIIELEKGNYDQAFILVNTALDLDANNSVFYNTMGNIELHRHKIANAEQAFKSAVKNNSEKIEYQYNLANFYLSQNQFTNAIDHFYMLLQNNPTHYLSIRGITVSYLYAGEIEIALEHANEWVREYSEYDEPYYYLGLCLFALHDIHGALAAYDKGLSIVPTNHEIMTGIGACYSMLGNISIAENYLHNALTIEPRNPIAVYNLGCIHLQNGDLDSAQNLFKNAVNLDAVYAEPLCGLGNVALIRNNDTAALQHFTAAIKLEPFNPLPKQLYAAALLRQQNFNAGWEEFKKTLSYTPIVKQIPGWLGQKLDANSGLLIWVPKETSDITQQILFASLLPEVLNLAAKVILMVDPILAPVMHQAFPSIKVCSSLQLHVIGEQEISYQIPISALGDLFRKTTAAFHKPTHKAFLTAAPDRVQYYKDKYHKLFPNKKLVGISWKAAKNNSAIDYAKGTQLNVWHKFLDNAACQFIAVQIGDYGSEIKLINDAAPNKVYVDLEVPVHENINLLELSAQLAALDEIVSVDNITTHLAGALGLQVTTLLPMQSEWYWFKNLTDSAWYENVKLQRQSQCSKWQDVLERLANSLAT